eukprot:g11065.t1
MQHPDKRRRCKASRGSSTLAAIFAVLVAGCSQSPACDAFLVPPGAPIGTLQASTVVQQGGFAVPWRRRPHHHPGRGLATPPDAAKNSKLSTFSKRVRGGGGMAMLAGLPAAVGSIINPAVAKASSRAVGELLCCCILGVVAAKKGVLTPVNVAALSKIVYGIFLPALLMVNVAKTIVSQPVASLLPIPVFAAIQIAVGLAVSRAAMRLLNIDPNTEMGRETRVCASFQNSGILPLIFVNAMFRGSPELLTRGVAYVSFYLMGWSPTFWTIGNNILTGHLDEPQGENEKQIVGAPKAKLSLSERAASIPSKVKSIAGGPTARKILSPPIVACLAGLVIGLSPPLRWLLMRKGAPLGPMWAAFSNLTAAYTPSGVLVLAGSLANCPPGKWFTKDTGKTILAVAMARWLLLPLLTSGLLFGGVKYGLVPQDPMLLLVLLIESCMPSAQNAVIMLQVVGLQDAAGRCARMLCTIYLISIVPVSILLTIFISALKLV